MYNPLPLTTWIDGWAVQSQQRARRNAMIAMTALTQRRAELVEVEEYLAALDTATAAVAPAPAANG